MAICLRHPLRLQSLHKNTFYYIIIINHDFENKEETMKLYENGAYLVNGRDVVINSPEAASAVNAKTGKTVTPEDAKKQNHCIWNFKEPQYIRQHGKTADQI